MHAFVYLSTPYAFQIKFCRLLMMIFDSSPAAVMEMRVCYLITNCTVKFDYKRALIAFCASFEQKSFRCYRELTNWRISGDGGVQNIDIRPEQ